MDDVVSPLQARDYKGGKLVYALDRASYNQGQNAQFDFEVSDKGINSPLVAKGPGAVCYSIDQGGGKSSVDIREDKAPTLTTTHDGAPAVCYSFDPTSSRDAGDYVLEGVANPLINGTCPGHKNAVCYGINGDKAGTPDSSYYKGCGMRSGVEREVVAVPVKTRYIVRRLTPLECERLQGYPDGWTDIGEWTDTNGKKRQTSDAARYKALGNSIALPPWKWVLKRLCACYERDATMASLFDGIGGFPYLWEQINGKGTCLWASEIEEFPIAVTKVRIGE
jgi:site-specific DNA-cytosine methylase